MDLNLSALGDVPRSFGQESKSCKHTLHIHEAANHFTKTTGKHNYYHTNVKENSSLTERPPIHHI